MPYFEQQGDVKRQLHTTSVGMHWGFQEECICWTWTGNSIYIALYWYWLWKTNIL